MKKTFLLVLVMALLVLSACSLGEYFPVANTSNMTLNDSFLFSEEAENNEIIILGEEDVVAEDMTEEVSEDVAEESAEVADVLTSVTVVEGDVADISFLSAQDPDGDSIRFSYADPFGADGTWETEDGDEGTYLIAVTASDGVLSTTESVRVVVTPSNKGPVIDCPSSFSVNEGETIELPCTIYDAEGDAVEFEVSGFMTSLEAETDFESAGTYTTTITATDGNRETQKNVRITILDVNRAPVVADLEEIVVTEGDFAVIDLEVRDPDGDQVTIEYPILFDNVGVWETERGDAGNYDLEARVSDGEAEVAVPVQIRVEKVNLAPTMETLEPIVVEEGEQIVLNVDAQDPDGDEIFIEYSGFMTSRVYTTTFDDAGQYEVTITITDGRHTVEQTVPITIENKNRAPVFIVR